MDSNVLEYLIKLIENIENNLNKLNKRLESIDCELTYISDQALGRE